MVIDNPLRRVPEAFPRTFLWRKLSRNVGPFVRAATAMTIAMATPAAPPIRAQMRERAQWVGKDAVERLQQTYFDNPGLDTLTVRELTKVGRGISRIVRGYLIMKILSGRDRDGSARHNLELMPRQGYDSLMMSGLAIGTAAGTFTGGQVGTHLWWDSKNPQVRVPEDHPVPGVRRFRAPKSLTDMAADIDDLYWAGAYGQAIKVTRVGEGENRRWLVSLPGTDHSSWRSEPNAADIEANFREELNLPSAIRRGTIKVIRDAMTIDGVPADEQPHEPVLICGHSQGGMIAVALAAAEPAEIGLNVTGVITLGSPTRRRKIRPDVQMLAVEHYQDVVPALDGSPRKVADQRVLASRSLNRPRQGALFYAHSSSTYTETVNQLERQEAVVAWGPTGRVLEQLQQYLPQPSEPVRVTHHYTWQQIDGEVPDLGPLDLYFEMATPDWEPVSWGGEVGLGDATPPPDPRELLARLIHRESSDIPEGEVEDSEDGSQ